jgi:hypothetical protein
MNKYMEYALVITLGITIGLLIFPLVYLLITGDFPGSKVFYSLQEDDAIVTFLLNIIE